MWTHLFLPHHFFHSQLPYVYITNDVINRFLHSDLYILCAKNIYNIDGLLKLFCKWKIDCYCNTNVGSFCFRILVGAPEAQTAQTGVYRGGSVFKCDIAVDQQCEVAEFDTRGKK